MSDAAIALLVGLDGKGDLIDKRNLHNLKARLKGSLSSFMTMTRYLLEFGLITIQTGSFFTIHTALVHHKWISFWPFNHLNN